MPAKQIVVQPCGCIALSETMATALRMLPGAFLSATPDPERKTLTLTVLVEGQQSDLSEHALCPVQP